VTRSQVRQHLALPTLLLAACQPLASDDPTNIPKRGIWEDATTMDNVTMDGRSFTDAQLPDTIRRTMAEMTKTERKCWEPTLRDKASFETLLSERMGECHLDDYVPASMTVSALMHCRAKQIDGLDTEPTGKIEGTIDADRIKLNIQAIVRINQKTGAANLVVMSGRRILKRLGDC